MQNTNHPFAIPADYDGPYCVFYIDGWRLLSATRHMHDMPAVIRDGLRRYDEDESLTASPHRSTNIVLCGDAFWPDATWIDTERFHILQFFDTVSTRCYCASIGDYCNISMGFSSKDDARQYVQENYPARALYFIAPYINFAWESREKTRTLGFIAPWEGEEWYRIARGNRSELHHHHIYRPASDPSKLAYTEDWMKGAKDRQLVTRPGRYLRKFFSDHLTEDEIEYWANQWASGDRIDLRFTTTREECRDVYENGPNSCMGKDVSYFNTDMIHPAEVYCTDECAIAYVMRDERVTARTVVNTAKKIYGSTVYGDSVRLRSALDAAGYSQGSLDGTKLLKIECERGYVMPYIDEGQSVDDCGDYFVIGGDIDAANTNGLLGDERQTCDHCGDSCDEDDLTFVEAVDGHVCGHCLENHFTYCRIECEWVLDENAVTLENGERISEYAFDQYGFTSDLDGENYLHSTPWGVRNGLPVTDMIELHDGRIATGHDRDDGTIRECSHSGEWYKTDDMTEVEDGIWVGDENVEEWMEENSEENSEEIEAVS